MDAVGFETPFRHRLPRLTSQVAFVSSRHESTGSYDLEAHVDRNRKFRVRRYDGLEHAVLEAEETGRSPPVVGTESSNPKGEERSVAFHIRGGLRK